MWCLILSEETRETVRGECSERVVGWWTIAADAEGLKEQRVRDAFFIVEPNRNQLMDISRLIDTGVIRN